MNYFIRLFISLLIGSVLLYISVKDVNFVNLKSGLAGIDLYLILYSVFLAVLIILLKSLRYALLLNPIKEITQKKLLPIVTIGLLAIIIVPLRMGEFVRPYLISRKEDIPFTSATTAVFIERLFEIAFLLCLIFYSLNIMQSASWIVKPALTILIIFSLILFILILFIGGKKTIKNKIKLLIKSEMFFERISNIYDNIHKAFYIFKYPGIIVKCTIYSIVIWALSAFSIYLILSALKISLPFSASILIMVITIIGISIPGAPGFVGNYQFANMMALSLYNINPDKAMLFSIIYYLTNIGTDIILGIIIMPFVQISIKDFFSVFLRMKNFNKAKI